MRRVITLIALVLAAITAHALEAGTAAADITPDVAKFKVPMAGYGARMGKPSTGVHDRLHAKVLYLRDDDSAFALVTCDLRSVTPELKKLVLEKALDTGLTEDTLLLCASHTHSGPSIFREKFWQMQFGVFDPAILEPMSTAIAGAVKQAVASVSPARAGVASGRVEGFTKNRRWEYDLEARQAAGETPALDPVMTVLRVDAENGEPKAILVNFATHPTILPAENMHMSADWPGVLQDRLEKAFPGATALFANGAEGDQAPDGAQGADYFEKIADFGSRLAAEAERLAARIETKPGLRVAAARITPDLPEITFSPGALRGPYSHMGPVAAEALPRQAEIQAFSVGDFVMVSMPGEPICEVGLDARKRLEALGFSQSIVIGLANDYIGYIVNEKEYAHGGYEVDSRSYYGPGLGAFIAAQTVEAAKRLEEKR